MARSSGTRNCEQKVITPRRTGRIRIQLRADGLEQEDVVGCFGGVGGVFPVDIEAVEAEVCEQFDGGRGKQGAGRGGGGGGGEGGRVGPAADGEERLEVAVGFFEEIELFGAAVEVCSDVVPSYRC